MRLTNSILLLPVLIASLSMPISAQEFEVTPDSTEGMGVVDMVSIFESAIINNWDQENRIAWRRTDDFPDTTWVSEICQLSLLCWPYWTDADTMVLPAEWEDVMQIKIYPHSEGVGSVKINLTAVEDNQYTEEITFTLDTRTQSVRITRGGSELEQIRWLSDNRFGGAALDLTLPASSRLNLQAFDILGRNMGSIWNESVSAGRQLINIESSSRWQSLPTGVYILRLEAGRFGVYSQRMPRLR